MILIGSALTLAVCIFALLKGGEAERAFSVACLIALFGSLTAQAVMGRGSAWPVIGADLGLGVTIGILAAIHLRAWLFVGCGLAAGLLLLHGFMLQSQGAVVTPIYAAVVDTVNLAMLATLAFATVRSRRRHEPTLLTSPMLDDVSLDAARG